MHKITLRFVSIVLILGVSLSVIPPSFARQNDKDTGPQAAAVLPESNDYATLVLGDAWDMNEYSDISQYINQSGQANQLENISVTGGVFSAQTTAQFMPGFHLLFPGYKNALLVGKVGHKYPIEADRFKCLYVAAKVDSGAPEGGAPDQMVVYWFANEDLNGGIWGQTLPGIQLYPEAGANAPTPRWKLFSLPLDQADTNGTPWSDAPGGLWQGLRIDATLQQTTFAIDWVRLTDCNPVNLSVGWSGSGSVSLSVMPAGTARDILVIPSTSANPVQLDTQGLEPGDYTYSVRQDNKVLASGSFTVAQMPIAYFNRPSFTSGAEYATVAGNPWDMSSSADIEATQCTDTSLSGGVLAMDTASAEDQPKSCVPGGLYPDPGIWLSTPLSVDNTQYRYFTFRMYTEGAWQNVPNAMVVRWVWYIQGTSGLPANRCILVSYGVPYDVGWQTYTVDLLDPVDGYPEQTSVVECPDKLSWYDTSPSLELRFDPNENTLGSTMHQELDWVTLTKMDTVAQGQVFPIDISLNLPATDLENTIFYFTTDRGNPHQHLIGSRSTATLEGAGWLASKVKIFLPVAMDSFTDLPPLEGNEIRYMWNTSGIQAGQYYLCADVITAENLATYCSEAPLNITP